MGDDPQSSRLTDEPPAKTFRADSLFNDSEAKNTWKGGDTSESMLFVNTCMHRENDVKEAWEKHKEIARETLTISN